VSPRWRLFFAIFAYFQVWNSLRGNDLVAKVAERFDKSYAEDAALPVRPGDKEWSPLLRIIREYTHADLPTDKKPLVFARDKAVLSAKAENTPAEWTAPTTPIFLLYKEWPGHEDITPADYRRVGTLEDLHYWISKDAADFDFLWRTIIFGILSLCVGVF
jgi:hypothetical protein